MIDYEPRQARKGAAVVIDSGAGVWLLEPPPTSSSIMTYQVLARKWRPKSFKEMVGQNHVLQALVNSLNKQRIHHAYLFTGTRGVGKTSIARLLAKALNCEQGISATPCLECTACLAIEQNNFIDLIEIDGASRTKVEDTREILDNVQYKPSQGRFKIYLIDEVHMLSNHSFNALLKTLEEPPPYIKFLLATTEPQKLPVTVLSRCLQFSLKCMTVEQINQHLTHILSQEKIAFEPEALQLIAQAADGSMRDSLSLLDQAIAYSNDALECVEVRQMLGYTQKDYALELIQALANNQAEHVLELCRQLSHEGANFSQVFDEILMHLHQIARVQSLPQEKNDDTKPAQWQTLAQNIAAEDVQLFYQIAIKGKQDIGLAPLPELGFEMTLIRMLAFKPAAETPIPRVTTSRPGNSPSRPPQSTTPQSPPPLVKSKDEQPENTPLAAQAPITSSPDELSWDELLKQTRLSGMTLNVARNASLLSLSHNKLELGIESGHQSMFTASVLERLEHALRAYFKRELKIVLIPQTHELETPAKKQHAQTQQQLQQAHESINKDKVLSEIIQQFDGELMTHSIKPLKSSADPVK